MFSQASVCSRGVMSGQGVGVWVWAVSDQKGVGVGPEGGVGSETTPLQDGYCCGQYASHWNTLL